MHPLASLPAEGFLRLPDLVGAAPVTEQEAARNRRRGRSPVRARAGKVGIIPISSASVWRKVKEGTFPAPVKISANVTAWRVEDVRAWLASKT